MSEIVINHESLYEILRREKYRAELQKLEPDFFSSVISYLKEKQAILSSQEKKDSIFASSEVDKTRTQIRIIKRMLRELYERRESKILQLALFNSRSSSVAEEQELMLAEEKDLFTSLITLLNTSREDVLFKLLNNELPALSLGKKQKDLKRNVEKEGKESEENGTKIVRFKCDIPEFVGSDLNTYGPFRVDETASLPQEVISFLEKNGQVEVI